MSRTIMCAEPGGGSTRSELGRKLKEIAARLSTSLGANKLDYDVSTWTEVDRGITGRLAELVSVHGTIMLGVGDDCSICLHYEGTEAEPLADFVARAHVIVNFERTLFHSALPPGVEYGPAFSTARKLIRRVNAARLKKIKGLIDEISESTLELTCR